MPALLPWSLRCSGCGTEVPLGRTLIWACPNRVPGDDVDHVLVAARDLRGLDLAPAGSDNPFVRYRTLLMSYRRWRVGGGSDAGYVELVEQLGTRVAAVAGPGPRISPLRLVPALGDGVWVKDETAGVAGSHKGRHLIGLMLHLLVAERLGWRDPADPAPLAIASCGNAALAAAVVARAAGRRLVVHIPPGADTGVVAELRALAAEVVVCRRQGDEPGDPCHRAFLAAVAAGAVPFGCQGSDNGLAIEGGATLGWELAAQLADVGVRPDRIVIQVGGGALATATMDGLADAVALGALAGLPVLHAVQTDGAWPLVRAHRRLVEAMAAGAAAESGPARSEGAAPSAGPALEGALRQAARHRSWYMWPWESEPHSLAEGILDDETYDWLSVLRHLVATGGTCVVVGDEALREANHSARAATGLDVSMTGSAGLAGLRQLVGTGVVVPGQQVVVLLTGSAHPGRGIVRP